MYGEAELMPLLPIGSLCFEGSIMGCTGSTLHGEALRIAPVGSLYQSRGCGYCGDVSPDK